MDEHNIVYRKKNLYRDSNNRQYKPIFLIDFHSFYWHVETIGAEKNRMVKIEGSGKITTWNLLSCFTELNAEKNRLVSSLSEIGGLIYNIELILGCRFYQQFGRIHKGMKINLKMDFGYGLEVIEFNFEVMILSISRLLVCIPSL